MAPLLLQVPAQLVEAGGLLKVETTRAIYQ